MEPTKSKVGVRGGKTSSGIIRTPFGDINVEIKVKGYKSSEGDTIFQPPVDAYHPK